MSDKTSTASGGTSIAVLLTILFVGLKLAHIGDVASWSWWWVLAPLWLPLSLVLIVFVIVVFLNFLKHL